MAYPASQTAAADAFAQINRTAIGVKAQATDLSTRSAAGPIPRHEVLELQRVCASAASRLQQLSTTPGLVAYAREQLDQPALDVAGEFAAMRSALIGLGDWINLNFPREAATQAVLTHTVDASGTYTPLMFSTAQLSQLRTHIATFGATVS